MIINRRMQQNDPVPAPSRQRYNGIIVLFLIIIIHCACSRVEKDFEKLGILGKGGFGVVYHVLHKVDKREYAIKMIPTT